MTALYTDYRSPSIVDLDINAINNSIRNILLTRVGSMPGKPDFGSRLHEVVFSQIDYTTINLIKKLINEALYKWEKRISLINVDVQSVPEYNKLLAHIKYRYKDDVFNQDSTISVNLLR